MMRCRAFTMIELVVAIAVVAILLFSVVSVFQIGIRRWDVQTSFAYSLQTSNTAIEKIEKDARNATSFTTAASGSNTLYEFTMPADIDSSTKDNVDNSIPSPGGIYIPERPDTDLTYADGVQYCYYLSDITGGQSVTGGTILWRASAPAGSSTFTKDTSWSLVNTTVARCSGIQSFAISQPAANPDTTVQVDMSVAGTSGHTTHTYTISREMYMGNHN